LAIDNIGMVHNKKMFYETTMPNQPWNYPRTRFAPPHPPRLRRVWWCPRERERERADFIFFDLPKLLKKDMNPRGSDFCFLDLDLAAILYTIYE
jgi:hypothetical protein